MFEDMGELTNDQLDAQLAVYTAVSKVANDGKKLVMDEVRRRILADAGTDRKTMKREVSVGGVGLGYITKAKDSVDIYDEDEYGLWAAEHNRGRKYVQVDVTDDPELLEIIAKWLTENEATWKLTGKADGDLKKSLVIRGPHVISWDGEVVPGAGVKTGAVSYRDCKPDEVASVMRILGQDMSVAGFLGLPTAGLLGE